MNFSNYKKVKTKIKGKPGIFSLWVADTPVKQRKGLSRISKLSRNEGMIFVYSRDEPRTFTMKNTFIPLHIIFLDKNFNIIYQEKARPRQRNSIECINKCRYVVEIMG